MSLTSEQITAEITANPALKTALLGSLKNDVIAGMKAEGVIVRSKDEETQFLTNYETNIIPGKVQEQIGAKIKEVHDLYDKDIFEMTGLKKGATEKTYEFNKRVLKELKEKAEKVAAGGDPVLADQIKELQSKLKERENYVAPDEVDKLKGKYFSDHVALRLSNSLDKKAIAIPAHITDEKQKQQFIEAQKGFIKQAFMQKFTAKHDDKGNIVFYEGDKLLTNTSTAAPLTEQELVDSHFSVYFVPDKKAAGGAGSGAGGGAKEVDVNESTLKTKKEVIDYLTKKGLVSGGAEFNKEYSRIIKDYAITQPGE